MPNERIDMSDWIIHFVHKRNPVNEAVWFDQEGNGFPIPMHVDENKAGRFDLWDIKDEELQLEPDAPAMSVLLKILDDGFIRTGWSMRNDRATIYGPRAACCFTEMPLHALLHYARSRGNEEMVDVYGIALRKNELFRAGARPVIYGLSGEFKAHGEQWPRHLDPACGISEDEQYRFVSMNLSEDRPIDWSHEREWRWSDVHDRVSCPGLPVWNSESNELFSSAIIIVRRQNEVEDVLDKLKLMRDAGSDGYENPYLMSVIEGTRVLAIEDALANADHLKATTLRLDDLPTHELEKVVVPVPTNDLIEQVLAALDEAEQAAETAAHKWRETSNGRDVFGFAYLMIDSPRSAVLQALLKLNRVTALGNRGYHVTKIGGSGSTHLLGEAEAAVEAAKTVLSSHFGEIDWYLRTVWD